MGLSDNGKLVRQTQAHDDYPYQDHIRSQPAFIVDGGQRKSSIMSYPNADGLNNYVMKTERVVELVRPVVTRRVLVNGNPVREERIVGAYEHGNPLKENLDNLGKVKDFFNQVQIEASMPAAPILSRPAKPNWPSQNDAPARPNWGSRAAWMSRDDSPPRYGGEHFEVNRPNAGTMSTYTSYDDSPPRYNQRPGLSRPSSGTKPNWPSRSDSPPRVMVQSGLISYPNSGARPKWPSSRDDSPPRRMVRPELMAHPNSGSRPNWSIRDDSPPRAMEYYESHPNSNTRPNWPKARDDSPTRAVEYYESHPNSNTRPNWAKARGDSPPKSTVHHLMAHPNSDTIKPNWPSNRDYSPPRSMMHPELSHPNSSTRPNWPIRDDSPPRAMEYYESHPKSNTRPNWAKAQADSPPKSMVHHPMARPNSDTSKPNWPSNRDYSPPRSMVHPELTRSNSNTMPNWHAQDDSPKYVEKGKDQRNTSPLHGKLEKVNIHGSRGSSPIPNKMNADNARSGSNVIKPTSYNGTSIDVPEGYSNQSVKKGNINSPNKENSQQVRESDQRPNWPNRKGQDGKEEHEKPKSNDGGHIKKGNNEEEIHGFDNPKSVAFEDTTPISLTQEIPKKVEDYSYKKPNNNQHDNLDDVNYSKKSSITPSTYMMSNKGSAGNTKPNFNGGWYNKHPSSTLTSATSNVDDLMKVLEEAKRTGAYPVASEMPHSTTPHWSEITPIPPQGVRGSGYSTISTPQWNEITPNPPLELVTQPAIDSTEARRRYGYPQPVAAAPMGYFGALSSEEAVRKYGGTVLPN